MFNTHSADQLAALFDQFTIPMFAAERPGVGKDFRILCNNRAHAAATGFHDADLRGACPQDLLPAEEASKMAQRYSECADTRKDLRYLEVLHVPKGFVQWNTSLQYVPLKSGGDRVIGTSFQLDSNADPAQSDNLFDDVKYLTSLADLQLQNLVSIFETAHSGSLFTTESANRVAGLSGICRTVQQAVADIKSTVRRANTRSNQVQDPPSEIAADAPMYAEETESKTVRAILESIG